MERYAEEKTNDPAKNFIFYKAQMKARYKVYFFQSKTPKSYINKNIIF
ncbi:hypothetical protein LEP1GSC172_2050 [Leptospira noguchii]|uniref:Uncharacterized protein n=2 Tax=Leptospira noguchii TaxID=28182 RepID=T0H0Y7_9LEPT|nr:hypothetical protein LEP1GSC172_2050 [Leptospira noguchii]EQA73111.1 hypothetical protein LEP1GSC059_1650 [Leptospira noguchii serovar Panama str. CZ214]